MATAKAWIKAARPRTLPLAVTSVMIGTAIAVNSGASFNPWVFGFAMLTVVYLQVLANFANDYGDFVKGTDTAASRSDRTLAAGEITLPEMKRALIATSIKALVSGLATLYLASSSVSIAPIVLCLFGVVGIIAALKYTMGSNAFGYLGLGDLVVFIFFGPVGVLGTAYLQAQTIELAWLLPATFSGLMSVAVLNLNNLRDHKKDAEAGKNTLVVKLGFAKAKVYHQLVVIIAWACMLPFLNGWRGLVWYIIIALVHVAHLNRVRKCEDEKELDPELKRIALSAFVVSLFMMLTVLNAA